MTYHFSLVPDLVTLGNNAPQDEPTNTWPESSNSLSALESKSQFPFMDQTHFNFNGRLIKEDARIQISFRYI